MLRTFLGLHVTPHYASEISSQLRIFHWVNINLPSHTKNLGLGL